MGNQVVIIGAGIAGLSAAAALRRQGVEAIVLDKGRGPGGRAATRRRGTQRFDHGAQYFTCRSAEFCEQVELWQAAGVAAPWQGRIVAIGQDGRSRPLKSERARYVGVPGMNEIARQLGREQECRVETQVVGLKRARRWRVSLDTGETISAATLVMTAPPAQSAMLLADTKTPLATRLRAVTMTPCWAVMVAFERAPPASFDAAFVNSGALGWVANDSSKPGRITSHCWVLHATPEWSASHLEDDPGEVGQALLAALARLTGDLPATVSITAHRWRYAQAATALDDEALIDQDNSLIVTGDWCSGSRIEGAWRGGRAAADAILKSRVNDR